MKKTLTLTTIVLSAIAMGAFLANALTARLTVSPGTLEKQIRELDMTGYDALQLSGVLNNADLITLRRLCGQDTMNHPLPRLIRYVDMKDVEFEKSGAPYFLRIEDHTFGIEDKQVIPGCLFYQTPVEKIVLPERLDSIGSYALWMTKLDSIVIPEGVKLHDRAIGYDSIATVLDVPAMDEATSPSYLYLPELHRAKYRAMDYMRSGSFSDMPNLEEIVFDGMIGHIDGYMIKNCPKLKRVTFNGPVFSTGGKIFAQDCPELEEIRFNGFVFNLGLVENPGCPKLKPYIINGAVYASADSTAVPASPLGTIASSESARKQIGGINNWLINAMGKKGFLKRVVMSQIEDWRTLLDTIGMKEEVAALDEGYLLHRNPDDDKTKLEILKESAPYKTYPGNEEVAFTYAEKDDSLLTRTREYFNLDSIAGDGDDISRIKNLMYWVHDLVRHDGSSSWPDCGFNIIDLHKVCQQENRGLNCRFMAMMLAEALLAEGIPARYVTCIPKAYDEDSDCHVINVAWSESLGKWVWVDPTFAAFVTDENGVMLNPAEVRERLRKNLPLQLNEDANWNHKEPQTKEDYLDYYMAKNLYIFQCNTMQQSEPEGKSSHPQGKSCILVPDGFEYPYKDIMISDETLFWQPPVKK